MNYPVALHKPKKKLHDRIEYLLALADVDLNSPCPWDIRVHNENFSHTVLKWALSVWVNLTWTAGRMFHSLKSSSAG